jgi:NADH dehydrogenase [ubiquinone] 1 alpha subcomplex assembly factor 5
MAGSSYQRSLIHFFHVAHGLAWQQAPAGAHARAMTDLAADHMVFDRRAVRLHRDRAARHIGRVADLLGNAAERLLDRLDDTKHRFSRALDIGGRGVVAPMLRARGIATVSCDLSAAMAALNPAPSLVADEEFLPFGPGSFDLIVASLALHWVNDLPGALIQIRHALAPDGLFLASLPALGTGSELRTAMAAAETALAGGVSPRVSPFPDLRDCAALLQRAGFALPVADVEAIRLLYADGLALLQDLRAAGETNAVRLRERRFPPRALFPAALAEMPTEDGRVPATLRLAVLTGWSPAPSQPRPLRPGSAQVSLAEALRGDHTPPES